MTVYRNRQIMKLALYAITAIMAIAMIYQQARAEGGMVRGENGTGAVHQYQEQTPKGWSW